MTRGLQKQRKHAKPVLGKERSDDLMWFDPTREEGMAVLLSPAKGSVGQRPPEGNGDIGLEPAILECLACYQGVSDYNNDNEWLMLDTSEDVLDTTVEASTSGDENRDDKQDSARPREQKARLSPKRRMQDTGTGRRAKKRGKQLDPSSFLVPVKAEESVDVDSVPSMEVDEISMSLRERRGAHAKKCTIMQARGRLGQVCVCVCVCVCV